MNSTSCLIAQLMITSEKSMIVIFSKSYLFQTCLLTLSEMRVVDFSESVMHVESLLYPPETFYTL